MNCRVEHIVGRVTKAAVLAVIFAGSAPGQTAKSAAAPNWVMTFDDEFEGRELEFPKWAPHDPWGHQRNREAQAYVPEAIDVRDGMAHIVANRAHARYDGHDREFTSGMMTTYGSFAQTYGRFEIRCRIPAGQGLEPKFWLLPAGASGELPAIDVLDAIGSDPAKAMFANRWGDERTERSYSGSYAVADLSGDFHIVAVEWDAEKIVWFVDGKERFRSVNGVPHQALYIAASLAVGGVVAKYPDESTVFPASFDIDYIRAWQKP